MISSSRFQETSASLLLPQQSAPAAPHVVALPWASPCLAQAGLGHFLLHSQGVLVSSGPAWSLSSSPVCQGHYRVCFSHAWLPSAQHQGSLEIPSTSSTFTRTLQKETSPPFQGLLILKSPRGLATYDTPSKAWAKGSSQCSLPAYLCDDIHPAHLIVSEGKRD